LPSPAGQRKKATLAENAPNLETSAFAMNSEAAVRATTANEALLAALVEELEVELPEP